MSGDGRLAVFVGTILQTGHAFALCDECLVSWAIGLVNVMTGVDPTPFLAAISDDAPADSSPAGPVDPGVPDDPAEMDPPPSTEGNGGRTRARSRGRGTATGPPAGESAGESTERTPTA